MEKGIGYTKLILTPLPIPFKTKIISVNAGYQHSLFVDEFGSVYSTGINIMVVLKM